MTIVREDIFPGTEFNMRVQKVRNVMDQRNIDTILLHSPSNIYYLCGHHTLNIWDYQCLVVPATEKPFMVLWQFEQGRFNASASECDVEYYENNVDPVVATINGLRNRSSGNGTIGLESDSGFLSPEKHHNLANLLKPSRVTNISGVVENIRSIKSDAEIQIMRHAQTVTDNAMKAAIASIDEGVDDRAITNQMSEQLIRGGTLGFSIFPMVAVGERSGTPHHSQNGATISNGDTVFLECSPSIHWYHAPSMRTALLGQARDPFVEKVADVGTEALNAMMEAMKPGVTAGEVATAGARAISPIRDQILFHDYYGYSVGIGFPPTWIVGGDIQIVKDNKQCTRSGYDLPFSYDPEKKGTVWCWAKPNRRRNSKRLRSAKSIAFGSGSMLVV